MSTALGTRSRSSVSRFAVSTLEKKVVPVTGARDPLHPEQKYPVLLEYAKASLDRIKQRLRHL